MRANRAATTKACASSSTNATRRGSRCYKKAPRTPSAAHQFLGRQAGAPQRRGAHRSPGDTDLAAGRSQTPGERHHHPVLGVVRPVPAQRRQGELALEPGQCQPFTRARPCAPGSASTTSRSSRLAKTCGFCPSCCQSLVPGRVRWILCRDTYVDISIAHYNIQTVSSRRASGYNAALDPIRTALRRDTRG